MAGKRRRARFKGPPGPSGPLVLGLESGGDYLSVALLKLPATAGAPATEQRLLDEVAVHRGHQYARSLLGAAHDALARHDLGPRDVGLVAVGRGPGGFTGIRVGMATGLGLALGLGVPLWPVDSLLALALHAELADGGCVAPMLDARKGEVYAALFRFRSGDAPETLVPPSVGPHTALLERFHAAAGERGVRVFGNGALVYGCASAVPPRWHVPSAHHTARLAACAWDAAGRPATGPPPDPAYVRASDAELAQQRAAASVASR